MPSERGQRGEVDWHVVAGTGGGVALLAAATVVGELPLGRGRLLLDVGSAAFGCAMLPLVLRSRPPAALVVVALAAVSPAATPAATAAVLVVARLRRLRTAVALAFLGVLAHAVQGLWRRPPGLSLGWWLLVVVCAHAALVAVGASMQARAALVASLVQRARQAEEEQGRRVVEARAAERRRMAREMHDVLGHRLSLVATYAGALEYRTDATADQISGAAAVVRSGIEAALCELREVVAILRADPEVSGDDQDHPQPSGADLPRLLLEARSGGADLEVEGPLDRLAALPTSTGRTAYRLVQEGLTNARQHAPGESVVVRLDGRPGDHALIEIRNRAAELIEPAAAGRGNGLIGMTERVGLAGGRLEHGVRGGEFVLLATLPWPA